MQLSMFQFAQQYFVGRGGKLDAQTGPSKVVMIKLPALQSTRGGPRYAQYCRNNPMPHRRWTIDVSDALRDVDGLQVGAGDDDDQAVPI